MLSTSYFHACIVSIPLKQPEEHALKLVEKKAVHIAKAHEKHVVLLFRLTPYFEH